MRNHRLGGHAAVDRPLWRGGDHDRAFARPAAVPRATGDADPQLRGHDIQLLAAQFANGVQQTATAWAVTALDIDQHFVTWQMCRQGAVVAVGRRGTPRRWLVPGWICRILCGLVGGQALLQILKAQL